jgi:DNA-binding winged helix-turn-helix (wHTH) protein
MTNRGTMSDAVDDRGGTRNSETRDLRFEMLGPLQVIRSGRAVDLGGPQQRTVLAVLLLESDRPVSVTRLAAALWGDRPPPGGTATIQTYVFHLREALEPDRARGARAQVLVTQRGGYRLETDRAVVDAREFETLARPESRASGRGTSGARVGKPLGLGADALADVDELEVAPVAARLTELRPTGRARSRTAGLAADPWSGRADCAAACASGCTDTAGCTGVGASRCARRLPPRAPF